MPADRTVRQVQAAGRELAHADRDIPAVPAVAGHTDLKAELADLRERMRRLGLGYSEIAGEIGRRYRLRPREAYRLAWGWTPEHAAARFNTLAADESAGPQSHPGLTGSQLREHERWPAGGRKPTVRVLLLLAQMYQTDVACLLDLADYENLAPQDRLTLIRPPQPGQTPFGIKLAALVEERGLSLREVAHRAGYSTGYLSNVIHGRKRATEQIAALLDDLLDAGGELVALAKAAALDSKPVTRRSRRSQSSAMRAVQTEGVSLSLPQVPCRLVIEICGPDVTTGRHVGASDNREAVSGRLALIPGTASSRSGHAKATRG
jgi:transcriptional regulator with XRE-family HTH domain